MNLSFSELTGTVYIVNGKKKAEVTENTLINIVGQWLEFNTKKDNLKGYAYHNQVTKKKLVLKFEDVVDAKA